MDEVEQAARDAMAAPEGAFDNIELGDQFEGGEPCGDIGNMADQQQLLRAMMELTRSIGEGVTNVGMTLQPCKKLLLN